MRRFLIPTLAFLASSLAFVTAQVLHDDDPVVIRLGSTTETLSELDTRFEIAIRSITAAQGVELDEQVRAQLTELKPAYLDQRAQEIVLIAEARERGLDVAESDLDEEIEAIRANAGGDDAFDELLVQSGIESEAALRDLVRENEMIQALYRQVESGVEIGDDELRTAYLDRRDAYEIGESVCARHILLDTVEDADEVLQELEDGADFAELAAERSTGPSGPQGGDLGCFERGQMVGPFEEAAFAAEVGAPVGPVETEFGQHVILVSERQEAGTASFEQVRDPLRQELLGEATEREIAALLEGSGVVTYPDRMPAPAGEDLEQIAPDASPDDDRADDDVPDDDAAPSGD